MATLYVRRTGLHLLLILLVWSGGMMHTGMAQPRAGAHVAPPTSNIHLLFGNPSNATANPSDVDNFLLEKPQFVLSYHNTNGTPNWVSWHLQPSDLGKADRQNDFRPDPALPSQFTHVLPRDYTGSGFDRGHLCNSEDRTRNDADNSATFVMTNIVPQTPDLNRGPWVKLESYARTLVRQGNKLSIIAGCSGMHTTIGRTNSVTVPTACWKVIVVLPPGRSPLTALKADTRVIAVDMPNTQGIKNKDWRVYLTTVREIEAKTGYDFLSTVPRDMQDQIETRKDTGRARAARTGMRGRRGS
jgi:endonuclease G